jgi:hypothetical protein
MCKRPKGELIYIKNPLTKIKVSGSFAVLRVLHYKCTIHLSNLQELFFNLFSDKDKFLQTLHL